MLRTDNGPEFLDEVFTGWAKHAGMAIQYIEPGKPNQNAYIERFNRTYREELLDLYLFATLDGECLVVRALSYGIACKFTLERALQMTNFLNQSCTARIVFGS